MTTSFKALTISKTEDQFKLEVSHHSMDQVLLQHFSSDEVLVKVCYSSLNYKDGLACSPDGKIVKAYPHIPGIDLAGIVVQSTDPRFSIGDQVIATGYELGVTHFGGYSEYAKVKGDWLVQLPQGLSLREAMILGTAGFTAALSIYRLLENGLTPQKGKVLVTGATGGVGSIAVAMLSRLGFDVEASTGKDTAHSWLSSLGATRIYDRNDISNDNIKALDKQHWSAAIDPVGGSTLASIVSQLKYNGSVAVSGLTGGVQVATTVFPFILRGINILGIDSVYCPMELREKIWKLMATAYKPTQLDQLIYEQLTLEQIPQYIPRIINGTMRGRGLIVIDSNQLN